jgi:hypothetical protein
MENFSTTGLQDVASLLLLGSVCLHVFFSQQQVEQPDVLKGIYGLGR